MTLPKRSEASEGHASLRRRYIAHRAEATAACCMHVQMHRLFTDPPIIHPPVSSATPERHVSSATPERHERRQLQEFTEHSPVEVDLVAGLLWIGAHGFTLQHPVGLFDADVYFAAERLCVEVDGLEFHNARTDRQRDRIMLKEYGVKTIRFRGADVWRDCVACAKFTAAQVGLRRKELRRAA